ncbi:hypothetical protein CEV32_4870 [Brucella rhizosphaerae]|uniref:Uncharacterized protein n=1 Tax=Brucella rhizosphaerae TaxID=571254 RepID=A0A256FL61_9HYPH|nr:hypothetical protein CEV32_4870 [Brucella rhizosphaerae]
MTYLLFSPYSGKALRKITTLWLKASKSYWLTHTWQEECWKIEGGLQEKWRTA